MKNTTNIFRGFALSALLGMKSLWALEVVPTHQMYTLEPGGETTGECTVTNSDNENIVVTPSSKDWFVLSENKDIKTSEWLVMDQPKFRLKKGESKTIRFKIRAPKKA